jgi:hypothetical protein
LRIAALACGGATRNAFFEVPDSASNKIKKIHKQKRVRKDENEAKETS